ncbi:MAG: beta-CASP ribonuclease aCPSF1 [Candidatus Aenigmatarchaeota archaeon]
MSVLEDIKAELPANAQIAEIVYEGPDIILYTENRSFFKDCGEFIRRTVGKVKKRIEVRAAASLLEAQEKTKGFIKESVPAEAGIRDIYFEPEFSKVVIHAEKPGLVIGKAGEILRKIKASTFWTPDMKRAPAIDSEVIAGVRRMLHREAGYRKKFLHQLGEKIYGPKKPVDWVRVTGLGGFREVGRSAILVSTPQSRVLLDCGVALGGDHQFPHLEVSEFNLQTLDAIVISHAHLDHSGLVPYLYEYGYRGPVFCTRPTRDLSILLQMDYIAIAQREGKKAPYTSKGIEEMIKHCVTLEFGQVTDITPDFRITLENSGHLLGASCVHMNIGDGTYNLLYSADMKFERTRLFDPAFTDYARVEGLIVESTYGDERLPSHNEGERKLIETVRRVVERGGRIIIPTFAVGRAQDVIAMLVDSDLRVPIYLDGMLWDATAIHTAYPEFMSRAMQVEILRKKKNPFMDPRLKGIGSAAERREAMHSAGPCIVLATSGMLQGGPAMEYLKEFAPNPANCLLFVGYQAEGTLGRRIQKGWRYIPVEGDEHGLELKLEIDTVEGLSGHSDVNQLVGWIRNLRAKPRKIIANHGENSVISTFVRTLHNELRVETVAPKNLETIRLK